MERRSGQERKHYADDVIDALRTIRVEAVMRRDETVPGGYVVVVPLAGRGELVIYDAAIEGGHTVQEGGVGDG